MREHPCNELHVGGRKLVDLRQRRESPPGAVAVRPGAEIIPFKIRRFSGLICAGLRITAIAVEVYAVVPRVGKHPVENDVHPRFLRRRNEHAEVALIPQHGVNAKIVRRVVAVVCGRFKDRVQIQAGYA